MTPREIIIKCLDENSDVTCRNRHCDLPEVEENSGETLDKVHDILINQPKIHILHNLVDIIKRTEKSATKAKSYRIQLEEEAIGYELIRDLLTKEGVLND